MDDIRFTAVMAAVAVTPDAEPVRVCACMSCGAAIVLDPPGGLDPIERHVSWHRKLEAHTDG